MDWKIGYGPPYHTICYIYSTVGRSIADIYDPRRHIYLGASLRFSHKSGSNTETRQSSATKHAHTESTCTHSFTPHVGSLCMTGTVLQWQLFHLLVEVSVPVSLHVIFQSLHHPIQPFLFVLWISLLFSLSYTGPCTHFVSLYPRCSCHLRNALRFASMMSMVLSDIHLLCFLRLPSRCFCVDSSTPFFSSYHLSSTPPCPSLLTKPFSMVSTQSATFVSVARAPHQIVTSSVL